MKDYSKYVDKSVSPEDMARLLDLCKAFVLAEEAVEITEKELSTQKDIRNDLRDVQIPQLAQVLEVEELPTLTGGVKLKLEDFLSVTPKKENRAKVLAWLNKGGQGGHLIRRVVSVIFNKDQQEEAEDLKTLLIEAQGLNVKEEQKVEPQTLKKHVKTLLKEGKSLPMNLLGVYESKRAKIVKSKKQVDDF